MQEKSSCTGIIYKNGDKEWPQISDTENPSAAAIIFNAMNDWKGELSFRQVFTEALVFFVL